MFSAFNWQQMTSAFIVLFAVIDIIGSIPIIINLKEKGKDVNAMKATVISFLLMIGFFYAGDVLLRLFHVDIESFAVAGSFVIFLLSLEMILDIEIFKNQGPIKEATLVPLVFPLLAGRNLRMPAGTFLPSPECASGCGHQLLRPRPVRWLRTHQTDPLHQLLGHG